MTRPQRLRERQATKIPDQLSRAFALLRLFGFVVSSIVLFISLRTKIMSALLDEDTPWIDTEEDKFPKAFQERSKFLFNNDILSDVKFVVRSSQHGECSDRKKSKMAIPAHKFLLTIRSPVFFAMFCGKMAETEEEINLPDCEYDGMLELLRFLYTDKVCLTENNVMQVAYLAAKYMVPSLSKKCAVFLGNNLDSSNVLGVLKHAQKFSNKHLLNFCWDYVEQLTMRVVKSNEFFGIEKSLLQELVERDTLNIKEVELFQAVDGWAEQECKRLNLKSEGSVKREILGEEVIKKLRFPLMEQREFMEIVTVTKILTQDEASNVVAQFDDPNVLPVHGFSKTERVGPPMRCCRYHKGHKDVSVTICCNKPATFEPITLTVDKNVLLHGVSLFFEECECDMYAKVSATVKVYVGGEMRGDSLFYSQTGTYEVNVQKNIDRIYHGFDVLFDKLLVLRRNVEYCIAVSHDMPSISFFYDYGDWNVVDCHGVTFSFMDTETVVAEVLFTEDI